MPENFDEARAEAMMRPASCRCMGLETALGGAAAAQTRAGRAGVATGSRRGHRAGAHCSTRPRPRRFWRRPGSTVPRGVPAPTLDAAARRAAELGAALALKGLGFAHKTEAGAVRLGLATLDGAGRDAGRDTAIWPRRW